jgi:hypothetical protein
MIVGLSCQQLKVVIYRIENSIPSATQWLARIGVWDRGIDFIDENGGGPGVRLRERQLKEKLKARVQEERERGERVAGL